VASASPTYKAGEQVEIEATNQTTKSKGKRPGKPLYRIVGTEILGFFQNEQEYPSLSARETAKVWIASFSSQYYIFTTKEPKMKKRP